MFATYVSALFFHLTDERRGRIYASRMVSWRVPQIRGRAQGPVGQPRGGAVTTGSGCVNPQTASLEFLAILFLWPSFETGGVIISGTVDPLAHGVIRKGVCGVWLKKPLDGLCAVLVRVQPVRIGRLWQDDGHSVVEFRELLVRLRRENRASLENVAVRTGPALPKTREREGFSVFQMNEEGLFFSPASRPFVETVRGDEAPPVTKGGAKSGLWAAVSERAFIVFAPKSESFAQKGTRPQRVMPNSRVPSLGSGR